MICLYLLLFFSSVGILIFILIKFLEEKNFEKTFDQMDQKRKTEYRKPPKQDITDL